MLDYYLYLLATATRLTENAERRRSRMSVCECMRERAINFLFRLFIFFSFFFCLLKKPNFILSHLKMHFSRVCRPNDSFGISIEATKSTWHFRLSWPKLVIVIAHRNKNMKKKINPKRKRSIKLPNPSSARIHVTHTHSHTLWLSLLTRESHAGTTCPCMREGITSSDSHWPLECISSIPNPLDRNIQFSKNFRNRRTRSNWIRISTDDTYHSASSWNRCNGSD